NQLFKQEFQHIGQKAAPRHRPLLKDSGTYLITGGLGDIGLVTAEHLARSHKTKLVLVGRESLPPRAAWAACLEPADVTESRQRKLRKLIAIEAAGGQLMTASADVADLKRMGEIVAEAASRFGPIHGVFHAAGILDDDLIQVKTQAAI